MVDTNVLKKLFDAFPNGFINHNLEFIAHPHHRINSFFCLGNCETEEDVAAKVLEWLSREAHASMHFNSERRNRQVHEYHLEGINAFCGTFFSEEEISEIYTYLGNCVNHPKTLKFIRSGYDMSVLYEPRGGASDA